MEKKVLLLTFLIGLVLLNVHGVLAANETTDEDKINRAYDCLEELIEKKGCDTLSSEEKIFSLLSIGKCEDEVLKDSNNQKCWPSSGCSIKRTAQAILALKEANKNTKEAEEWLLSKKEVPSEIDWFLQIENPNGETICSVTYSGSSHDVVLEEDRTIRSGAGSCLTKSSNGYWLKISENCYGTKFSISCNKGFSTNLLYKKSDSSTIYVSSETHGTSAEGTTHEEVNIYCFGENKCDYEGTLWTILALDALGNEVNNYLPYLIAMAGNNKEFLPEAFLEFVTGEYRDDLISEQKGEGYWDVSGDKFYDTALALYPLSSSDSLEKKAKTWLLEIQGDDGCWDGIGNTAFILYTAFYKSSSKPIGPIGNDDDCVDMSYFCISPYDCNEAKGDVLDFNCASPFVCCNKPKLRGETCTDMGGEECSYSEDCIEGYYESSYDTDYCCIGGKCEKKEEPLKANCETLGEGICRNYECEEGEKESYEYTCDYNDVCCIKEEDPKKSYWWIWLLIILIILVIIGIIFKDKLRRFWFKFKSKGKSPKGPLDGGFPRRRVPPGRFPSRPSSNLMRPRPPRRIFPPQQRRPPQKIPKPKKKSGEIDDILKKLKEIGK